MVSLSTLVSLAVEFSGGLLCSALASQRDATHGYKLVAVHVTPLHSSLPACLCLCLCHLHFSSLPRPPSSACAVYFIVIVTHRRRDTALSETYASKPCFLEGMPVLSVCHWHKCSKEMVPPSNGLRGWGRFLHCWLPSHHSVNCAA